MQSKLKKLLKEINLDEQLFSSLENASIEKVVVYDKNKMLNFIINNDYVLSLNIYNQILTL